MRYKVVFKKYYYDTNGKTMVSDMKQNSTIFSYTFSTKPIAESMIELWLKIGETGRAGNIDESGKFINSIYFSFEGKIILIEIDDDNKSTKIIQEHDCG